MSKQDFEYFRQLDAFLVEQEALNAEQKKWAEHDVLEGIGRIGLNEVVIESPLL